MLKDTTLSSRIFTTELISGDNFFLVQLDVRKKKKKKKDILFWGVCDVTVMQCNIWGQGADLVCVCACVYQDTGSPPAARSCRPGQKGWKWRMHTNWKKLCPSVPHPDGHGDGPTRTSVSEQSAAERACETALRFIRFIRLDRIKLNAGVVAMSKY